MVAYDQGRALQDLLGTISLNKIVSLENSLTKVEARGTTGTLSNVVVSKVWSLGSQGSNASQVNGDCLVVNRFEGKCSQAVKKHSMVASIFAN